jgi:hypothetical protein
MSNSFVLRPRDFWCCVLRKPFSCTACCTLRPRDFCAASYGNPFPVLLVYCALATFNVASYGNPFPALLCCTLRCSVRLTKTPSRRLLSHVLRKLSFDVVCYCARRLISHVLRKLSFDVVCYCAYWQCTGLIIT